MLRARDAMDRTYAGPLDIPALAAVASVSEAHFIRTFRATFGETPHRYLQRRRVERAMFLLTETQRSITDVCFDVGFASLGTFSRTFRDILGVTPTEYRATSEPILGTTCFIMATMRPSSLARPTAAAFQRRGSGREAIAQGRAASPALRPVAEGGPATRAGG